MEKKDTVSSAAEKEKNTEKKEQEGWPEIAQSKHNPLQLLLVVIAILGLGGYGWWATHKTSRVTSSNESFQISNEATPLRPNEKNIAITSRSNNNTVQNTAAIDKDASILAAQKALTARLQAPLMVVGQNNAASEDNTFSTASNKTAESSDPNTRFLNQMSQETVAVSKAQLLNHLDTLIAQGNLIHAVLETAINSDLPGYLRATVSYPVYSEDGSQVLIPAASRLIGQYKSQIKNGQSRIFIVWNRVITPSGMSVSLGSPGIDHLGIAGLGADAIDYHFWQMFGTATLLSILGAGASNVGVNSSDQFNASQAYRQAVAESLAQTAQNSLQQNTMLPPTLHVNQGTPIVVFVAKDLQFQGVIPTKAQKIAVF